MFRRKLYSKNVFRENFKKLFTVYEMSNLHLSSSISSYINKT